MMVARPERLPFRPQGVQRRLHLRRGQLREPICLDQLHHATSSTSEQVRVLRRVSLGDQVGPEIVEMRGQRPRLLLAERVGPMVDQS